MAMIFGKYFNELNVYLLYVLAIIYIYVLNCHLILARKKASNLEIWDKPELAPLLLIEHGMYIMRTKIF